MASWQGIRGTRQERGYGREWDKLRAYTMERDAFLCQPCAKDGRTTPAKAVDHITPKSQGGTDDTDNLQAICNKCHQTKTEQEAAKAQGRRIRVEIGPDGWPTR